ncbi:MAG: M1 family aminopeptidase [Pyrinomonadaceae bacterium]
MPNFLRQGVFVLAAAALTTGFAFAQQAQKTRFDVTNYRIEAQLVPSANRLQTIADVTFVPADSTRSVTFELNGSLKVESITRLAAGQNLNPQVTPSAAPTTRNPKASARPAATPQTQQTSGEAVITFVQDQVGVSDTGPNVRIDLGETIAAGTPVTLRFKYSGTLLTPEGGPLANKKLASIGDSVSYLMYASRWFPFHDYAADRATAEILITVPAGTQVVGYSDEPVTQTAASGGQTRYRLVNTKPALIGNLAAGKFISKSLRFGSNEIQFFVQPTNEGRINEFGETIGKALEFYTAHFGAAANGNKLVVAQIDDESLDTYSGAGMMFLSAKLFENTPLNANEKLERETAYQWWGQTVGLKSFDDAWLSQGLAEYSALELRESKANSTQTEEMNRELLERALTFEQTASLVRAPATLDDQSSAYQYIVYYKGSAVFRLLRETMGRDKFNTLLKTYLTQYRGKNSSIDDFETLASKVNGTPLRYFFARWVEGTGVPEFKADYQIIRTRSGKFIARGTVTQNYDNLRLPVDVKLRSEGDDGSQTQTLKVEESSEDFNLTSTGKPLEVVIDPSYKLLRIDDDLRVSAIARRGIEQYKDGNFAEAQQQFEAALKLDRSNSWVYYNLGLLFLEQRNYDLAIDNFKASLGGNLRPQWLQVWANVKMGNAYDSKGDRPRAVAAYKRAENLGDDYDGAQTAVKKYLAAPYDPKNKEATASK